MPRLSEQQYLIVRHMRTHGPCARADIADTLGINGSVTSELVRQLLSAGLLQRNGLEASGGGRPRQRVQLNPAMLAGVGVHVSMRRIRGVLVDATSETTAETAPVAVGSGRVDETLDAITETVNALKAQVSETTRLSGVGIGISGVIREGERVTREFPHGERWQDVPLADVIESRCGIRPTLVNDVHAAALGELRLGG